MVAHASARAHKASLNAPDHRTPPPAPEADLSLPDGVGSKTVTVWYETPLEGSAVSKELKFSRQGVSMSPSGARSRVEP
eukprot:3228275-Prymnesium_polylepis.1